MTATFTKDCCDREVMAWRAWEGRGLPGEPVRKMLIKAVPAAHVLEFLSDNGGAYIAADTRALARSLGLKPINTPVCSPQSNGMAKSNAPAWTCVTLEQCWRSCQRPSRTSTRCIRTRR